MTVLSNLKKKVQESLSFMNVPVHAEGDHNETLETRLTEIYNALIQSGLGFFGALIGVSLVGDFKAALFAAGVSAGFQFFASLALQRGLAVKQNGGT